MLFLTTIRANVPATRTGWEHGLLRFAESDINHTAVIDTPLTIRNQAPCTDVHIVDSYCTDGTWHVLLCADSLDAVDVLCRYPYCVYAVTIVSGPRDTFAFTDWHVTMTRTPYEETAEPIRLLADPVPQTSRQIDSQC